MRREIVVAAWAATLCFALTPAYAQGLATGKQNDARVQHEPRKLQNYGLVQFSPRKDRRLIARQAISASEAAAVVQQLYPNATVLAVRQAPNGDFVVTVRLGNQVRRVRVDGQTGGVK
jgi:hypothetical protein